MTCSCKTFGQPQGTVRDCSLTTVKRTIVRAEERLISAKQEFNGGSLKIAEREAKRGLRMLQAVLPCDGQLPGYTSAQLHAVHRGLIRVLFRT